jgi:hypothetical protein
MFRFTIRELVLVMVIVAMGLGWWFDHRRLTGQGWIAVAHALANALQFEGCSVELQPRQVIVKSPRGGQHTYGVGPREGPREFPEYPDWSYYGDGKAN